MFEKIGVFCQTLGNISYARSKWVDYDEPEYTDPDQIRLSKVSGAYTDRRTGYIFDGLFCSQQEIDQWPLSFDEYLNDNSLIKPGDRR